MCRRHTFRGVLGLTAEYATWCLSGDFDAPRISITFDGDSGDVLGGLVWRPTQQGANVLLACGAAKKGAARDLFGGLEEHSLVLNLSWHGPSSTADCGKRWEDRLRRTGGGILSVDASGDAQTYWEARGFDPASWEKLVPGLE